MSKIFEMIIEKPINCPYLKEYMVAGFNSSIEVRYTCCRNNIVCSKDEFPMQCPLKSIEKKSTVCLNPQTTEVLL